MDYELMFFWICEQVVVVSLVMLVCIGVLLFVEVGFLEGCCVMMYYGVFDLFCCLGIDVVEGVCVVDDGVVSLVGVVVGIDMVFCVVVWFCGEDVVCEMVEYIEYLFFEGFFEVCQGIEVWLEVVF